MRDNPFRLPAADLKLISNYITDLKEMYTGSEILLYGGTGFIGRWLTESLIHADLELNLGLKVTIVTRNIESAKVRFNDFINIISSSDLTNATMLMGIDYKCENDLNRNIMTTTWSEW